MWSSSRRMTGWSTCCSRGNNRERSAVGWPQMIIRGRNGRVASGDRCATRPASGRRDATGCLLASLRRTNFAICCRDSVSTVQMVVVTDHLTFCVSQPFHRDAFRRALICAHRCKIMPETVEATCSKRLFAWGAANQIGVQWQRSTMAAFELRFPLPLRLQRVGQLLIPRGSPRFRCERQGSALISGRSFEQVA